MSIILGINAFHGDSSSCLVNNGVLVSAAEEERFRRIKHWAGFPTLSIKYCLENSGIDLSQVDIIAINSNPHANINKKVMYALRGNAGIKFLADRIKNYSKKSDFESYLRSEFKSDQFLGEIRYVEHHLSHLASSHLVSPYDQSISLSIDGLGDFVSTAWGVGDNNNITIDNKIFFPHSLGIFYEALTHFLGFKNYGDEYKVMGLAPYGKPRYIKEMNEIVKLKDNGEFELNLDFFSHHKGNSQHTWNGGVPHSEDCFSSALSDLLGAPRTSKEELSQKHIDIAHSVQKMYENAFFHILHHLHAHYSLDTLTLSGGCAMNSVANGKIFRKTPFKQVYVQSAAGDAGGAIGAAFVVANEVDNIHERFHMNHAYYGPKFDNDYHKELLDKHSASLNTENCVVKYIDNESELCMHTATEISNGNVIGWFQGRMEWGPRALGNRSILCDPRRSDMKDILNIKIKRRESFRPFAPSILREHVNEWFEEENDVPFMMQVFQIRENKATEIPAVTHVDGSGRLQTVSASTNSRYHNLISQFYAITGVPIILNTSFNENEPVVCRPEEALNTFLRTKMDLLVLGNWMVTRK